MSKNPIPRRGATMSGYGLVVGLIAVVALTAIDGIGEEVDKTFNTVSDDLTNVVDPSPSASASASASPPNQAPVFSGSLPAPGPFTNGVAITPFTVDVFTDADGDALSFTLSDAGSGIAADFAVGETDNIGNPSDTSDGTAVAITGTPSQEGTFSLTITATDTEGNQATAGPISFTVDAPSNEGASCLEIKTNNPSAADGVYEIDPDGSGGNAPFNVYCDMTADGGGWTIFAYLKASSHWNWGTMSNQGVVGDTTNGYSTELTRFMPMTEKIVIYRNITRQAPLGYQWLTCGRSSSTAASYANMTSNIWTSGKKSSANSPSHLTHTCSSVTSHGATTYDGAGMFVQSSDTGQWHGTQTGDNGCPDGNNICWMSVSDGCNVGDRRCADLSSASGGVLYGFR